MNILQTRVEETTVSIKSAVSETRDEIVPCLNTEGNEEKPQDLSLFHEKTVMETMESDPQVAPAKQSSRDIVKTALILNL